jgi:hypothetical protein
MSSLVRLILAQAPVDAPVSIFGNQTISLDSVTESQYP